MTSSTHHLGKTATALVINALLGTMYAPDDISHNLAVHKNTVALVRQRTGIVSRDWQKTSWMTRQKYSKPIIGSAAWANLVFGEAIATGLQGGVQALGGSNTASIGTALLTALVVEVGFAVPIALRNRNLTNPVTTHHLARATGTAFWLGGAWGVEQEKLRLKHAILPIGSYMVFGTVLALVSEYNNLAQHLIESPIFYVALVLMGVVVKINDITNHEGFFERMGKRTAIVIDTAVTKRRSVQKTHRKVQPRLKRRRA